MMTTKDTQVTHNDPIGLGGLDWQWAHDDKFALVEAVALCTANGWNYPEWVRKIIGEAMTNMYQAVYPDVDLDLSKPGRKRLPEMDIDESLLADELKRELAYSLDLLGFTMERTNAVRRRKITARDLYLADLVASRCTFVRKPEPKFKGVNKVIQNLAAELMDGADPSPLEKHPEACVGANEHAIERAWKRYLGEMIQQYLDYPDDHTE